MKIYFSGARIGEKKLLSKVLDYAVENLRQPERLSLSLSFLDEEKCARSTRKRAARTSLPMF